MKGLELNLDLDKSGLTICQNNLDIKAMLSNKIGDVAAFCSAVEAVVTRQPMPSVLCGYYLFQEFHTNVIESW